MSERGREAGFGLRTGEGRGGTDAGAPGGVDHIGVGGCEGFGDGLSRARYIYLRIYFLLTEGEELEVIGAVVG